MFYDDYDLDYTHASDYTYDLVEMCEPYTHLDMYTDLDDEYARDSHDYTELAYRHYAW